MALPCTPTKVAQGRNKVSFDRNEVSDIKKRATQYRQLLNDAGIAYRNKADEQAARFSKAVEHQEAIWQEELGEMIHLKPNQRDAIGGLFASLFGIKVRGVIDPTLTPSTAGAVRGQLLEAGRLAENQLQLAAKVEYTRRVDDVIRGLQKYFKGKGLDISTQKELLYDAITVGQIPRLRQTYGPGVPAVEMLLNARYNDFVDRAIASGLGNDEVDMLVNAGERVSTVFDEMRTIAVAHGVDVANETHWGYFPWNPTSDFQWRMDDFKYDIALENDLKQGNKALSDVWKRSQSTWHYLPDDDMLASKLLGLESPTQLREIMADPVGFRSFLHNNLSAEQLDTLVDAGIMHKLPMTGREVFDYMVKQYELPYKSLNEMFILDPHKAVQAYADNLKDAVRKSAQFNAVTNEGLKAGWVVTPEMRASNPEFKDFVPLKKMGGKFIDELSPDEVAHLDNAFVHPIVADQWSSLMEISSNPVALGNAAKLWDYLQPLFTKSILLGSNVAYVGRVFIGNIVALHASGGHMLHAPSAFMDVLRSSKGFDFLNNDKVFKFADGKTYSERQLFEKLLIHRNVHVAPLQGTRFHAAQFESLDPRNAPGFLKYLWSYTNSVGTPWSGERFGRMTKYAAKQFSKQVNEAFTPLANFTQQMDVAFKWAALKTYDLKRFKDFDAVLRHLDNYFYMYDDPGKIGGVMNKYVQPFTGYMMQNPPAMLRFMLRSPQKFIAYNRLIQLWNAEVVDENNPPPDGGFRQYEMSKYPILLSRDPNSREFITLFPKNYDPILDAVTFFDDTAKATQHLAFGWYSGNSEEQRNQAMGKAGWQKMLSDALDNSYWSQPVQVLTGYDPYTGQVQKDSWNREDSFLGFRVNGLTKALLSIAPPLQMLDYTNPFDIFGRREIKDEYGKVVAQEKPGIPEKLGLPGAGKRTSADTGKRVEDKGSVYKAMRLLGMNVKVVNTAINMQTNLEDIKASTQEIRSQIVPAQKQLALDLLNGKVKKDSEEFQRRSQAIDKAIDTWLQLEFDQRRIQLWLAKEKVPPKDALKELRDRQIAASMLPMPGASTVQKLLSEAQAIRNQQTYQAKPKE